MNGPYANEPAEDLTHRFHEFSPSDRKVLRCVLEHGGERTFMIALQIYLQKWADANWLAEDDIDRIGLWISAHFPDVASSARQMAKRHMAQANNSHAKKTYAAMVDSTR